MQQRLVRSRFSTPVLGLGAVLALAATLVAGCGAGGNDETAAATPGSSAPAASSPFVALHAAAVAPPERHGDGHVVALGDSLPPEIAVSVEDTLVRAGDVVEISAQGSDDVSQVGLSDGVGRM